MTHAEEIAWAAGFFEGEGHISFSKKRGNKKYVAIGVTNTDLSMLEWFQQIVGVGKIEGPELRPKYPNAKPIYRWKLQRWNQIREVLTLFWPFLSVRRKERALQVLEEGKPTRFCPGENAVCQMPDCVSPHVCKGFCNKHYVRWSRYGDPTKVLRPWGARKKVALAVE